MIAPNEIRNIEKDLVLLGACPDEESIDELLTAIAVFWKCGIYSSPSIRRFANSPIVQNFKGSYIGNILDV